MIGWLLLLGLGSHWAVAKESVKIGLSLGLTGRYALMADMQQKAYRLWQRQVNSRGGLLGRQVDIVIKNDQSQKGLAPALYEELITKDKVDFIFGPYSSAITLAVSGVAERYGYPMLAAGAASDKIWQQGFNNVFGMWTPASRYTLGFLKMLLIMEEDKLAIVSPDDSFSKSVGLGAREWATRLGLTIKYYQVFAKGAVNYQELATVARQSGAQILMMTGHFEESVAMRQALTAIHWQPRGYLATVGPTLPKYLTTLGPVEVENTFAVSIWEKIKDQGSIKGGAKEFAKNFEATYTISPSYHAATAFAAGQILEAAVKRANSFNRDKVREALFTLDTYSLIGRYAVDRTGVQVKRFPLTIQWQQGKKEIVWPEALRTKPPVFTPIK
ncbi:amino acid ABC transporter substrate-binding protein [Endozoicomonas sp. SM1973]|uniref:Amino acid ABC transporter substrate-binding protein n=1 Tax=Spartinivicinus marinus TaxID=2994442 RepID=A0A853I238_9GAMM|nr:amino acid ABC transporter substrate-binding protein [Spartinivicinus marinus]MCX4028885.1 amino acid ABC transporter substrate-binding protein [Spartinivicinus marinus]NYZ65532.1 amino acid ABC transporter substrate-binding protein [Spartinivicinus marinus]